MENLKHKETQNNTYQVDSKTKSTASEVAVFVRAAVRLGCRYLAAGGPTSRLEERLTNAGQSLGFKTEVFTTPTGVFVSAMTPDRQKVMTFVGRVKDASFSLSELEKMELALNKLASGQMTPTQALTFVKLYTQNTSILQHCFIAFGCFLIGFMAALFNHGSFLISTLAGCITAFIHFLSGPVSARLKLNRVFSNFASAIIGFGLAAMASITLGVSMQAVGLGGLIVLAPGLMLTTAITEIAEQNYVSGIAKFMKSMIHLLGMLVAYLLVVDCVGHFGGVLVYDTPAVADVIPKFFDRLLLYGVLVLGMCISLRVPFKAIPGAMVAGFTSWLVFNHFITPSQFVTAPFFASLAVGVVSVIFGSVMRLPSQIFSTPGILSLVPGVLAMSSFHSLALLDESALQTGLKVVLIASSIVFGLFTARVPLFNRKKEEFGLESELHEEPQNSKDDLEKNSNQTVEVCKQYTASPNSDASISLL